MDKHSRGGGKSLTGPAPSFFTVYTARGHARKRKKSFPNKRVIVNNQNTHIFSGSMIPHPEDDVVVFAGFITPLVIIVARRKEGITSNGRTNGGKVITATD